MSLSRESLEMFASLLGRVQIPASVPDVVEQAQAVAKAKQEIAAELAELGAE